MYWLNVVVIVVAIAVGDQAVYNSPTWQLMEKELLAGVNCPCGVAIEKEQHMTSVLHSAGGSFVAEKKLFCNRQGLICS